MSFLPDSQTHIFLYIMLIAAAVCFITGELTRNFSQVDKLWSIMPMIYSLIAVSRHPSPRLYLMSLLVVIWGLRLSYNFYRKGGYNIMPWKGEEDYRWNIVRQYKFLKGRLRITLFNLLFISLYQQFLIFLFSSPLLLAAQFNDASLSITDCLAGILMLLFIIIESISDNQQFRFQNLKRSSSEAYNNGFLSDGLWAFVRHPNYSSEQAIWICFYFFGVAASGKLVNWTLAGSLLLILLFKGSSDLTEKISKGKYPGYSLYQKNVPRFVPKIFRRRGELQKKGNV